MDIHKKYAKPPIFLPTFNIERVLFPPFFSKLEEIFFRLLQGRSGVDFLQIGCHLLDVLLTDEVGGGTNLVDDTPL